MTLLPQNRMADTEKRGQGRPPKSEPRLEPVLVTVDTTQRVVPAITRAECCGRGTHPSLERWRGEKGYPVEVADCICQCGRRGVYYPGHRKADGTLVEPTYRLK